VHPEPRGSQNVFVVISQIGEDLFGNGPKGLVLRYSEQKYLRETPNDIVHRLKRRHPLAIRLAHKHCYALPELDVVYVRQVAVNIVEAVNKQLY